MFNFIKEYQYKTELHAHTSPVSACSEILPKQLVENYAKLGFHSVVVTNHFEPSLLNARDKDECIKKYLMDYYDVKAYGDQLGVHAILGMEIRFVENANDYLVFGIDEEFIAKSYDYLDKDIKTYYQAMKNDNNIILQAHPFRKSCERADPAFVDGVETYNMHPNHNSSVAYAIRYAKEHDFIVSAGTDFHHPGMDGLASILTKVPVKDSFELANILKSRDYLFDICGDIVLPYIQ